MWWIIGGLGLAAALVTVLVVRAIRNAPMCLCNKPDCGGSCWIQ